jgi:hypothetical protein
VFAPFELLGVEFVAYQQQKVAQRLDANKKLATQQCVESWKLEKFTILVFIRSRERRQRNANSVFSFNHREPPPVLLTPHSCPLADRASLVRTGKMPRPCGYNAWLGLIGQGPFHTRNHSLIHTIVKQQKGVTAWP